MTISAKVINLQEVADYIKGLPGEAFKDLKRETAKALFQADNNIKSKTELKRRTGTLMKSITTRVEGSDIPSFEASIYTDVIYAPIHEKGGTVRAKNAYRNVPGGPYLNIPTKANKTAAGVQRMTARTVFERGGRIVQFKPFSYGVILDGKVMFTLHKSSKIPARLNMVSSVEEVVPTLLSTLRDTLGE